MHKKQTKSQKGPSNPKRRTIERADQIRALASPTRQAVMQVVLNQGDASVREIAHQLERKPASLYKHIDALLACGLLSQSGTEPTTRRDAKIFTTDYEYIRYAPDDPDMVEALIAFVESEMRLAMRGLARSFRAKLDGGDAPITKGPTRESHFSSYFAWLSDDELAQINEHIDTVHEILNACSRREGTKLISVQTAIFPTPTSTDLK